MRTPNNNEKIIDSRDVIDRIEELNEERKSLEDELNELNEKNKVFEDILTAVLERASELCGKDVGDFGGAGGLVDYIVAGWEEDEYGALAAEITEASEALTDLSEAIQEAAEALANWDEFNQEELKSLQSLEAAGLPDWKFGTTLVRDSYFTEHAVNEADSIFGIEFNQWPYTCIDWEQAATELQQDYTQVDFDGVTYWARA